MAEPGSATPVPTTALMQPPLWQRHTRASARKSTGGTLTSGAGGNLPLQNATTDLSVLGPEGETRTIDSNVAWLNQLRGEKFALGGAGGHPTAPASSSVVGAFAPASARARSAGNTTSTTTSFVPSLSKYSFHLPLRKSQPTAPTTPRYWAQHKKDSMPLPASIRISAPYERTPSLSEIVTRDPNKQKDVYLNQMKLLNGGGGGAPAADGAGAGSAGDAGTPNKFERYTKQSYYRHRREASTEPPAPRGQAIETAAGHQTVVAGDDPRPSKDLVASCSKRSASSHESDRFIPRPRSRSSGGGRSQSVENRNPRTSVSGSIRRAPSTSARSVSASRSRHDAKTNAPTGSGAAAGPASARGSGGGMVEIRSGVLLQKKKNSARGGAGAAAPAGPAGTRSRSTPPDGRVSGGGGGKTKANTRGKQAEPQAGPNPKPNENVELGTSRSPPRKKSTPKRFPEPRHSPEVVRAGQASSEGISAPSTNLLRPTAALLLRKENKESVRLNSSSPQKGRVAVGPQPAPTRAYLFAPETASKNTSTHVAKPKLEKAHHHAVSDKTATTVSQPTVKLLSAKNFFQQQQLGVIVHSSETYAHQQGRQVAAAPPPPVSRLDLADAQNSQDQKQNPLPLDVEVDEYVERVQLSARASRLVNNSGISSAPRTPVSARAHQVERRLAASMKGGGRGPGTTAAAKLPSRRNSSNRTRPAAGAGAVARLQLGELPTSEQLRTGLNSASAFEAVDRLQVDQSLVAASAQDEAVLPLPVSPSADSTNREHDSASSRLHWPDTSLLSRKTKLEGFNYLPAERAGRGTSTSWMNTSTSSLKNRSVSLARERLQRHRHSTGASATGWNADTRIRDSGLFEDRNWSKASSKVSGAGAGGLSASSKTTTTSTSGADGARVQQQQDKTQARDVHDVVSAIRHLNTRVEGILEKEKTGPGAAPGSSLSAPPPAYKFKYEYHPPEEMQMEVAVEEETGPRKMESLSSIATRTASRLTADSNVSLTEFPSLVRGESRARVDREERLFRNIITAEDKEVEEEILRYLRSAKDDEDDEEAGIYETQKELLLHDERPGDAVVEVDRQVQVQQLQHDHQPPPAPSRTTSRATTLISSAGGGAVFGAATSAAAPGPASAPPPTTAPVAISNNILCHPDLSEPALPWAACSSSSKGVVDRDWSNAVQQVENRDSTQDAAGEEENDEDSYHTSDDILEIAKSPATHGSQAATAFLGVGGAWAKTSSGLTHGRHTGGGSGSTQQKNHSVAARPKRKPTATLVPGAAPSVSSSGAPGGGFYVQAPRIQQPNLNFSNSNVLSTSGISQTQGPQAGSSTSSVVYDAYVDLGNSSASASSSASSSRTSQQHRPPFPGLGAFRKARENKTNSPGKSRPAVPPNRSRIARNGEKPVKAGADFSSGIGVSSSRGSAAVEGQVALVQPPSGSACASGISGGQGKIRMPSTTEMFAALSPSKKTSVKPPKTTTTANQSGTASASSSVSLVMVAPRTTMDTSVLTEDPVGVTVDTSIVTLDPDRGNRTRSRSGSRTRSASRERKPRKQAPRTSSSSLLQPTLRPPNVRGNPFAGGSKRIIAAEYLSKKQNKVRVGVPHGGIAFDLEVGDECGKGQRDYSTSHQETLEEAGRAGT